LRAPNAAVSDSRAAAEHRLGLTRAARRTVQGNLTALGHDTRGVDGIFGPGTRTALRRWQRANDLPQTGYLTSAQVALLNQQTASSAPPPEPQADNSAAGQDRAYWARTGGRGTADGHRAYLESYPDGLYASEGRRALRRMADSGSDPAAVRERELWRQAQAGDRQAGYEDYLGRYPNGIWQPEAEARLAELAATAAAPGQQERDYWARTGGRGTADGHRAYLESYPNGLHASEARQALRRMAEAGSDPAAVRERELWRQAQVQDRRTDYQTYLEGYPNGIWQPEATARLGELAAGEATPALPDPIATEAALGLTRTDRLSIEQRLAFLGFAPGPQDGSFNADTRWAIEGYQRSRGHGATGYLDRPTVAAVMNETRDASTGVVTGADTLINILRGIGQ
jgi:peptidoglycan hydrolase-like protein with peptidoglycan-binding domain